MAVKNESTPKGAIKTHNNHSIRKEKYASTLSSMNSKTHVYECMRFLIKRGKITNAEAVELDNNYRLSSTIDCLRKTYGVPIRTEMKTNKNTGRVYGIYHLEV